MDQRLYIALLDHAVDDRVSASLFVWLSVSDETRAHQTDDCTGLADRYDVQRFERQG